jgi:hypothetical protein
VPTKNEWQATKPKHRQLELPHGDTAKNKFPASTANASGYRLTVVAIPDQPNLLCVVLKYCSLFKLEKMQMGVYDKDGSTNDDPFQVQYL